MRSDLKESLRAEWPHLADDFIAVDEACSRWLKRREALRRAHDEHGGILNVPANRGGDCGNSDVPDSQ